MSSPILSETINAAIDSALTLPEEERLAVLVACDKLKAKLENPVEKTMRIVFATIHAVALRLAIDMKLFDAAAELIREEHGKQFSVEELAAKTKADEVLITRVMRFMATMGIFNEVGTGTFTTTPLASVYVTESPLAQGVIHFTSQNENIVALPSYFAEHGYVNPSDAFSGPFQYARSTNLHCFAWLAEQSKLQHASNIVMSMTRAFRGQYWFEYYPVLERLGTDSSSPSPSTDPNPDIVLVDIGGGVGHDLIALQTQFPTLSGHLVLQDLPVVIESIESLPEGITAMAHDFFSAQPIRGARAYCLANVLHDWPDKQALQILTHICDAMSEKSVILLSENVLPESGGSLASAIADFMMMANFASLERTEAQFRTLLEAAGLKLVRVWKQEGNGGTDGRRILEAVLKRDVKNA